MFREKTILRIRREEKGFWSIRKGKNKAAIRLGISRLFRLISTLIQDKGKIYAIDITVKRRR